MTRLQSSLAIALFLGLLLFGFFSCFEKKTIEVPTPGTLEAAQKRYLGISRLYEAMGHEVVMIDGVHSLDDLPPTDATLIVTTRRRELTQRRGSALLEWMESGGHLILRGQSTFYEDEDPEEEESGVAWHAPDLLLDPFGLRLFVAPEESADDDAGDDETASSVEETDSDVELEGEFVDDELVEDIAKAVESWAGGPSEWDASTGTIGDGVDLRLLFEPGHWRTEGLEPIYSVAGADGVHLLTLAHGNGFLTALTDEWFLLNAHFGKDDHAQALLHLARVGGRRGSVYILESENFPGLSSLVAKYAWPALVGLAILVFGWLWRSVPRFGPVTPDRVLDRREWIEHLEAVGDFHWRRNRARTLIESTRAGVLKLIGTRHPALARLPSRERDTQISQASGLNRAAVESALDEREFPSAEATVARTLAHLERIRSSL